jgi:hypothetical protein
VEKKPFLLIREEKGGFEDRASSIYPRGSTISTQSIGEHWQNKDSSGWFYLAGLVWILRVV